MVDRAFKRHLAPLGLTYPQYITLALLWEKDPRTVGEVGESLAMETSTVTPLLKRMETAGLVTRQRSKTDERQVIVSLTKAGRDLQSEAPAITARMVADTGLDRQSLGQLVALLHSLKNGYDRQAS